MKARLLFGAPILVSCLGLTIGLLALWSGSLSDSKDESLTESVQQEIKILRVASEEFSEKYATQLMQILEAEMVTTEATEVFKKSAFEAVALGLINDSKLASIDWYRTNLAGLDKAFFEKSAGQLEINNANSDQIFWKRIEGSDRKAHMLLAVRLRVKTKDSESVRLAVGVLPIDSMMVLMSPYHDALTEVFVIDSSGFSLAAADTRYLGSQMDVHPVVTALSRHDKIEDFFKSRSLSNHPTIGGYQQAKNSNLFIVLNRSASGAYNMGWGLLIRSLLLFIAFAALGIGINFYLFKPKATTEAESDLNSEISTSQTSETLQTLNRSRMEREILNRTLTAISGGLRSSIYSLIGKCHLMMPKLSDSHLREDVQFMETELRKIRETIESIEPNAQANAESKLPILDLSEVIRDSMSATSKDSIRSDLHFHDHLFPGAVVRASRGDLEFITTALLKFVIHKKPENAIRDIQLRSIVLGGVIRFEVIVPGLILDSNDVHSAFSYVQSSNVDLALGRLMARGMGGDISVHPGVAQCILRLDLPKAHSEIEILVQKPESASTEDFDTGTNEVEDDESLEDVFETSEISMEIKDPALSNTSEIEPQDDEEEITRPITNKKVDEDTVEVKIRNPKVRLDL